MHQFHVREKVRGQGVERIEEGVARFDVGVGFMVLDSPLLAPQKFSDSLDIALRMVVDGLAEHVWIEPVELRLVSAHAVSRVLLYQVAKKSCARPTACQGEYRYHRSRCSKIGVAQVVYGRSCDRVNALATLITFWSRAALPDIADFAASRQPADCCFT